MKRLFALLAVLAVPAVAIASGASLLPLSPPTDVQPYTTATALVADTQPEGVVAYAKNANQFYMMQQATWIPLGPSPLFDMTFDLGASKGLALIEQDFTAYSTTADATNIVTYSKGGNSQVRFQFTTNTAATATLTPTADSTGLDLMVGGGDNDEGTYSWGAPGVSGAPIIPGSTPAGKFCVKLKIHDVSGSDGCFVELASAGVPVDLSSGDPNYASYCAIGNVSGDIKVSDSTTGATDTTDNVADDEEKDYCILWSNAGACTYTIDAAAPTVTDAHTLGAGVPVVPRVQCINNTDLSDDLWMTRSRVVFQ